ncbi:tumor necrosis factor receptor superfamily member 5 isoform X2 [Hoplias malabaricus]|uniref:tumor necrosis factor receptor superfamily member 5 isoform X2 n=1 Tax=Hoplias malabaricus TaxID=27720 RepID=UPI0034624420
MSTTSCHPDQHKENGLCCDKCAKGEYAESLCTSSSKTKCNRCPRETFSNVKNIVQKCMMCKQCHSESQYELKPCKEDSDRACECKEGFYCTDYSSGHCNHCVKVIDCIEGEGVSVQPTRKTDTKCTPCPKGTFSNVKDFKSPCLNHTDCAELGRHLLSPGNATTDAVCGDIKNCGWMIPAGLWTGFVLTILISLVVAVVYWRSKRKSQQVHISENSVNYFPPGLPPDIIKHPMSPKLPTLYHKDETIFNTMDYRLECDSITLTTITASEKCAPSTNLGQCLGLLSSDPSTFPSEPQEDEWPGS